MKKLWVLLMLLLCPGVEGEEPETEEPETEEPETEEPETEEPETEEPEQNVSRETRAQREIRTLRERAQQAERLEADARRQLEEARRLHQNGGQPQMTDEQRMFEQEEAVLRNPETTEWQRYSIQSARQARQAEANSRAAIRNAEDIADRASFDRLKAEKPKLHEKYATQVESMLTEMRSKGSNAPRSELMALLIGRDALAGKLTAEKKSTKPNGDARTKPASPRSSVSATGNGMTEAEKRAKRLENVRI